MTPLPVESEEVHMCTAQVTIPADKEAEYLALMDDVRLPSPERLGVRVSKIGKISKFCKFLAGSFSAVSKRNFARKYAFDSIFQALQDLHPFAPLQSQNFRKKSV